MAGSSSAPRPAARAALLLLLLATPQMVAAAAATRPPPRRRRRARQAPLLLPSLLLLALTGAASFGGGGAGVGFVGARPAPAGRPATPAPAPPVKPSAKAAAAPPVAKAGYGSPACALLDAELDAQRLGDMGLGVSADERCDARCRAETMGALTRLYELWRGDGWEVNSPEARAADLDNWADPEGDDDGSAGGEDVRRLTNDRPWEPAHDYCAREDGHSCHVSAAPESSAREVAEAGARAGAGSPAPPLSVAEFSEALRLTRAQYKRNPRQPEYCCWSGVVCCLDYGSSDGAAQRAGSNGTLGGAAAGTAGGESTLAAPCVPYTVQALVMRGFGADGSLADAMEGPGSPLRALYRRGLRVLRLSSNDLRGRLTDNLGEMPLMRTLDLADNWLEGELPPALGAMPGLIDLALDFNLLEGPIARARLCDGAATGRSPAGLAALQALTARANALTGPVDVRGCVGLRLVDLRDNRLTGTLPFGAENQALTTIRLSNNDFSGRVPEDVWFVQFLNVLDLSNNSLTGSISPAVADAGHLNTLYMARNRLSGEIPPELFLAPQLSILDLALNPGLNGSLPRDMTNAVGMTRLLLRGTSIGGPIPASMSQLLFLTDVDLRSTEMSCCASWDQASRANATTQARLDAQARGEPVDPGRPGDPELLPFFLTFSADYAIPAAGGSRVITSTPGAAAPDGTYPGGGVGAPGVRSAASSLAQQQQQQPQPQPQPQPGAAAAAPPAAAPSPRPLANESAADPTAAVKGAYVSSPAVLIDLVLGEDTICPSVRRSGAAASSTATGESASRVLTPVDLSSQVWLLDPSYYWDMRCRCQAGLRPVRREYEYTIDGSGAPLRFSRLTCEPLVGSNQAALAAGLAVGTSAAVLLACLFAWCMCFRRVSRTQRALAAASKRLKGCPRSGAATFVVTDIEGYSDLMKSCPDAMLRALSLHNAVLRRAKYGNVGYTLEQEGDSFALLFHTPYDAASFCLQAQQALLRIEWPRSLIAALDVRMSEEAGAALEAAGVVVCGAGDGGSEPALPQPPAGAAPAAPGGMGGGGNGCSPSPDGPCNRPPSVGGAGWLGEPLDKDDTDAFRSRRRPSQQWARQQPTLHEDGSTGSRSGHGGGAGGGAAGAAGGPRPAPAAAAAAAATSASDSDDTGGSLAGRTVSASTGGSVRDLSPSRSGKLGRRGGSARANSGGAARGPSGGSTIFARLASSPSVAWLGGNAAAAAAAGNPRQPAAGRVPSGGDVERATSGRAHSGGAHSCSGPDGGAGGPPAAEPLHHRSHANVASPLLSAVTGPFRGLRVRMGIATGVLPGGGQDPRAAAVFQMAKAVCDSASGGQVLMDARTFAGIKEDLHALGATDAGGLNYRRLASKRSVRDALCCAPPAESDEAVVLDMGAYVVRPGVSWLDEPHRGKPPVAGGSAPLAAVAEGKPPGSAAGAAGGGAAAAGGLPTAAGAAAAAAAAAGGPHLLPGAMDAFDLPGELEGAGLVARQASLPGLGAWARPNFGLRGGGGGAGGGGGGGAAAAAAGGAGGTVGGGAGGGLPPGGDPIVGALASKQRLRPEDVVRLVQILAPPLVGRAKAFGNALSLPAGWVCVDPPYFSAPAAGELPLVPEGRREAVVAAVAALEARAAGSGGAGPGSGQSSGGGATGGGGSASGHDTSGQSSSGVGTRLRSASGAERSLSVILSGGGATAGAPSGALPSSIAGGGGGGGGGHNINMNHASSLATVGGRGSPPSFFGGGIGGGGGGGGGGGYGARSSLWRSVGHGPSGAAGGRSSAATAVIRAQQAAAAGALLTPSLLPLSAPAPPITMAFVSVEGAKALSKRRRAYAREMHALILGLAAAALAHVAPAEDALLAAAIAGAAREGGDGGDGDDEDEDEACAAALAAVRAAAPRGTGYLCREQEGELKYMVAFSTPRAALEWCLVLQEAAMYLRWPRWVLQSKGFHAHHGPAMAAVAAAAAADAADAAAAARAAGAGLGGGPGARPGSAAAAAVSAAAQLAAEAARAGGGGGLLPRAPRAGSAGTPPAPTPPSPLPFGPGGARTLLFRGPRLKMGVCEGVPSTVLPDHLGRADYHGSSVNQAARYMDAGAHGGQIVCEAETARRVFDEWAREARALAGLAAARAGAVGAAGAAGRLGPLGTGGAGEEAETDTDTDAYQDPLAAGSGAATDDGRDEEDEERGGGEAVAAVTGSGPGPRPRLAKNLPSDASPARGASRLSSMQRGERGGEGGGDAPTPERPPDRATTPSPPPLADDGGGGGPGCVPVPARPVPPGPRLAPPAGAARRPVRVEAHWAGRYRFKGNPEPVDLVAVTPASLAGRLALLPPDPPKGKGVRLHSRCGLALASDGSMLPALPDMYRARVPAHVLDPPPGALGRARGLGGGGGGWGPSRSGSSVSSLQGGVAGPPAFAGAAAPPAAGAAAAAAAGDRGPPAGDRGPPGAFFNHAALAHLRVTSMPSSMASGGGARSITSRRGSDAPPSFLLPGRDRDRDLSSMTLSESAWAPAPPRPAGSDGESSPTRTGGAGAGAGV